VLNGVWHIANAVQRAHGAHTHTHTLSLSFSLSHTHTLPQVLKGARRIADAVQHAHVGGAVEQALVTLVNGIFEHVHVQGISPAKSPISPAKEPYDSY